MNPNRKAPLANRFRTIIPSLLLALLLPPGRADAQLQVVNTPSEALTIGGWFQPVFEYRGIEDAPDVMGSYFRRVRLDVAGSIMEGRVRFRLYPEFAPTVSLRDAWVEYRWGNGMALRMGQQVIPFDLQREKSMGRAHFGERTIAARRFELSGGRDIGAVGRWSNSAGTGQVSIGLFNATGANRRELGPSPLIAGRGVISIGGTISSGETDLGRSETPVLTLGAGFMTASESLLRPRPGFSNEAPTDWLGWTADLHGRWQGFSVAGAWFAQTVSPISGIAEEVEGQGWFLSGGWVLPGSPAEIAVKHSEAKWDRDTGEEESETAIGVTVFHRRHELQTRIQLIFEENPVLSTGGKARVLTIEHQLLLGG
jgi:hypothetical protein